MLYLDGTEFALQTDQEQLVCMDKAMHLNYGLMRSAMFLQNYWFTMEWITGQRILWQFT